MRKSKTKRKKPAKAARSRSRGPVVLGKRSDIRALARLIENDWRALAADAIGDFREVARICNDDVRSMALRAVSKLERRLAVLSGQLEMFP